MASSLSSLSEPKDTAPSEANAFGESYTMEATLREEQMLHVTDTMDE